MEKTLRDRVYTKPQKLGEFEFGDVYEEEEEERVK